LHIAGSACIGRRLPWISDGTRWPIRYSRRPARARTTLTIYRAGRVKVFVCGHANSGNTTAGSGPYRLISRSVAQMAAASMSYQDITAFRHRKGFSDNESCPGSRRTHALHGSRIGFIIRTCLLTRWRVTFGDSPTRGRTPLLARMWAQAQSIRRQIVHMSSTFEGCNGPASPESFARSRE